MTNLVELKNVSKSFGDVQALREIPMLRDSRREFFEFDQWRGDIL